MKSFGVSRNVEAPWWNAGRGGRGLLGLIANVKPKTSLHASLVAAVSGLCSVKIFFILFFLCVFIFYDYFSTLGVANRSRHS